MSLSNSTASYHTLVCDFFVCIFLNNLSQKSSEFSNNRVCKMNHFIQFRFFLDILREQVYDISTNSWILCWKFEGFISADEQRKALMLQDCDTFPFHLVCFIRAQEIYTYFESFVRGMLLIQQRKALKNSMSKSELPVKHSFDGCVCMKHIWNTWIHTIRSKCLLPHSVCRTGLFMFSEQFALFSFHTV